MVHHDPSADYFSEPLNCLNILFMGIQDMKIYLNQKNPELILDKWIRPCIVTLLFWLIILNHQNFT